MLTTYLSILYKSLKEKPLSYWKKSKGKSQIKKYIEVKKNAIYYKSLENIFYSLIFQKEDSVLRYIYDKISC